MTGFRIHLGRDAFLVSQRPEGLELEGRARLRPGYPVEIVGYGDGAGGNGRRAVVWTWMLKRLGSAGPLYRGFCRWQEADGERTTRAASG